MTALPHLTREELAQAPRPLRRGDDLPLFDQAYAVRKMAPGHVDGPTWLAGHVFACLRDGRLDRRAPRPVAVLDEA